MSMREAILRFRELHQEFKAGAFKSPAAMTFYESERDDFLRALLQAQQLTLRPGQSPRQAIRVGTALGLTLDIGPRRETTTTLDLGSAGFAAMLGGPLAPRIACEFELSLPTGALTGRARVVASTRDAAAAYRTSFAIDGVSDEGRARLEVTVIDTALEAFSKR